MGSIIENLLKPSRGFHQYSMDETPNISIGSTGFDVLNNNYLGADDGASGPGMNGTVYHEAYITDDGNDYLELQGVLGGGPTYSSTATTLTVASGTFATNTWIQIADEKMWVINWSSTTGALIVERGQLGTTADTLKSGYKIYAVGGTDRQGFYSKPYKVPSGYWCTIKCISDHDSNTAINIQANSLGPGDNFSSGALFGTYNPSSMGAYIGIQPGEMIHGKFNRVALDEATGSTQDGSVKLILYRG